MSVSDSVVFASALPSLAVSSTKTKVKRKNSEKRKERSRYAARHRRSQESEIFSEMASELPFPSSTISQMDKASVVRLAISYLKTRHTVEALKSLSPKLEAQETPVNSMMLTAVEGFLLILSSKGEIIYLSENVDKYLGICQTDLLGHSIYEFCHPCDHNEIKSILCFRLEETSSESQSSQQCNDIPCSFFVRMKCTLTNKGRNVNLKSASYKPIHCTGYIRTQDNLLNNDKTQAYWLMTIAEPLPHPANIERPLDKQSFVSRHSLDMKFTHIDDSIYDFFGYTQQDLQGKSMYSFFHASDLPELAKCCQTLFAKGQCETGYYRFLAKNGGYAWLLTQVTLISDQQTSTPQYIVCVNYVLSGIEEKNAIISSEQLENVSQCGDNCAANEVHIEQVPESTVPFKLSTKSIFTPRTADMDSGFLVFTDDEKGLTLLPEEQVATEDLTHLAPQAGDVLDVPEGFLEMDIFDDIFDQNKSIDFTSNLKVCSFEADLASSKFTDTSQLKNITADPRLEITDKEEFAALQDFDSSPELLKARDLIGTSSMANFEGQSPLNNDPFLSYQDELARSDTSGSSPISSDPYSSGSDSPCLSSDSPPMLSEDSRTPPWNVSDLSLVDNSDNQFDQEDDLEMRTPYISMDSDFPLLMHDELHPMSGTNIDEIINLDALLPTKTQQNTSSGSQLSLDTPLPDALGPPSRSTEDSKCVSNLAALLQTGNLKRYNCNSGNYFEERRFTQSAQLSPAEMVGNMRYIDKLSNGNSQLKTLISTRATTNAHQAANFNYTFAPTNAVQSNRINFTKGGQITSSGSARCSTNFDSGQNMRFTCAEMKHHRQPVSQKRPYPAPSEPPPKQFSAYRINSDTANINQIFQSHLSKRTKVDNVSNRDEMSIGGSVLMNLLVNGEDVSNGYTRYSNLLHRTKDKDHNGCARSNALSNGVR